MCSQPLKILFVTSRLPSHLKTGDRLRAYRFIEGLIQQGHQVDLLAFESPGSTPETEIYSICHAVYPISLHDLEFHYQSKLKQVKDMLVGAYQGFPRRVWQFHSDAMQNTFAQLLAQTHYDVVHYSEIGVAELAIRFKDNLPSVRIFDLIDAVSLSVRSSLTHRFDISWPARLIEAYTLRRFETKLLDVVDAGIVVSLRDKAYLTDKSNLHVIPMGIHVPATISSNKKEFDLIFVGNMSVKPNIDAIHWFVHSVLPHIWAKRPGTTLYIVGRDPVPSVRQLANHCIKVTGSVPDTNWYINRAKVFVAPLRIGAGQKIKLLEAFANAVPVVATQEANQGTGAQNGHSIILQDAPHKMAESIINLLEDEKLRLTIGENGFKFVQENFTWERAVTLLNDLYRQAM
ncbi:MAG: glycosyltransferase family 4 protein [Caldilineaceae bacterium]